MTELTVEEIQEPTPQPVSEEPPPEEPPQEPPEPEVIEEPAELPPEPAPKKRGRPAGSKNKPKAEPKRRSRQARELTPEPSEIEPPTPIDVDALLQPIFRAYMATSELRKRQARQQRYDSLFQGMVG